MKSRWAKEKDAVADAAREIASLGLVTGSSGNVSVRLESDEGEEPLLAITPSGRPYAALRGEDIMIADFEVEPVEGELIPSSETLLHVGIYRRRREVNAVIHTHSVYCSIAAVAGIEIPPIIDEMVVYIGGAIKVSEYGFPSTQELADAVCAALGDRNAALIKNHGAIGVGRDLRQAIDVCALVERVAQIYVYASLLGKVDTLPADVVEAEMAMFRMRQGLQ